MCPDSAVPVVRSAAAVPPSGDPSSTVATEAPARPVMSDTDIARALRRIAHEILEHNRGAERLVVLGIPTRGVVLAQRLVDVMAEVEGVDVPVGALDVTMHRDDLRSQPTRSPTHTSIPHGGVDGRTVVLVDDVLYSGRTVRAALDALSDLGRPSAVRLAVLVDRGHRDLPIRADHVGKNLPTARGERVQVRLSELDELDVVRIAGGDPR